MISIKNDLSPWDPPSCNLQNQTPYQSIRSFSHAFPVKNTDENQIWAHDTQTMEMKHKLTFLHCGHIRLNAACQLDV